MSDKPNCRHCADTGMATLGSTNSLFCSWCNNDGTRINIAGTPHPDTARADAAERMLAGALAALETISVWPTDWKLCTDGNVTAISTFAERTLADLTARRDREREALAATERELSALTPSAAPSPASAG